MPTVAFITLGCKVNQTETDAMAGLFKQCGYQVVEPTENADAYVVNTCSVTHLGERKSRQKVRRVARLNPGAIIAVTGCFAQLSPAEVAAIEGVDIVLGTQERARIVECVEDARQRQQQVCLVGDIMTADNFEDIPLQAVEGRTRAFLKIQDGCDNYCSYCIIPYARGHLRSRPLESIARESRNLAEAGFREIVLTGINLGAYGRETGSHTLFDAARTVLAEPRIARLRLSSIESLEISEELIGLMEHDPRMCPHLHLPLQSGEDSILHSMRRTYVTAEYGRLLERLRQRVPDLAVTTDIIVGFPGETAAVFAKTAEFVQSMGFAKIHVFPYSKRAGTPAATYAGQVSDAEKKRRVAALMAISEQSGRGFRKRFLGRTMPVLLEKTNSSTLEGLTPNYQRVQILDSEAETGENQLVYVKLEEVTSDGFSARLNN